MGGKSTLSRSASAAALLGLCGLLVPCSEMHMPFFDAIMMRGASGDSPLEGKSTFALEMKDLKAILDHTSSKSFVAIDELGKGTESDAGTRRRFMPSSPSFGFTLSFPPPPSLSLSGEITQAWVFFFNISD